MKNKYYGFRKKWVETNFFKDELENSFQSILQCFRSESNLIKKKISSTLNKLKFPLFLWLWNYCVANSNTSMNSSTTTSCCTIFYTQNGFEWEISHHEWIISPFSQTIKMW